MNNPDKQDNGDLIDYQNEISRLQSELSEELVKSHNERSESYAVIKQMNIEKDERIRFFTIISHDLRTPIGVLSGFLDMLIDDIEEMSKGDILIDLMRLKRTTLDLSKLTESLLLWAKHKINSFTCEKSNIDISSIIQENCKLFCEVCRAKSIVLNFSKPERQIFIYADFDMIDAAIRNVISNAIKFTHTNGNITIRVARHDDHVDLSITDNGIGMSELVRSHLFCPSSNTVISTIGTNGERGSGLGLLLCKELIEKNDGDISVSSKEDVGTCITFKLKTAQHEEI